MAYTTIDDPSKHFDTVTYSGTGSSRTISYDFEVDFFWCKMRNDVYHHSIFDSSRGANTRSRANENRAEEAAANTVSFGNSSGVTLGTDDSSYGVNQQLNDSSAQTTYVAWAWKANGGSRTTNAEVGNNPAGGYQANTTAGFSIVDYTGTGAAGTMAHGLGAVPSLIMVKNRDVADAWAVYHSANTAAPETDYLVLNELDATADDATYWNDTAPTSSVFTVTTAHNVNADGEKYMAYCFAEIQGYSKFGSYTGNGDADGTFVYTGFRPKYVMWKRSNDSGGWTIWDDARDSDNEMDKYFYANTSSSEYSGESLRVDFLSNGFKHRSTNTWGNGSDDTYIYIAFAEQPFVTSGGVPCMAR